MYLISRVRSLAPSTTATVDVCNILQKRHATGKKQRQEIAPIRAKYCQMNPRAKTTGMRNSIVLERAWSCGRELIVIVAILGQALVLLVGKGN